MLPIEFEQLLDRKLEQLGDPQRKPHGRVVTSGFDRHDRLAGHACPVGKLLLGQVACAAIASNVIPDGIPGAHGTRMYSLLIIMSMEVYILAVTCSAVLVFAQGNSGDSGHLQARRGHRGPAAGHCLGPDTCDGSTGRSRSTCERTPPPMHVVALLV